MYHLLVFLSLLEVWFHCDGYLENSGLMLSSSRRLCRFLSGGYKEEVASRLPLHSSSTSQPLQQNTETAGHPPLMTTKNQILRYSSLVTIVWQKLR